MALLQPDQSEAIALIIDTSSSAADDWDEIRQTAQRIHLLMGMEQPESFKLFMFGTPTPISSGILDQANPPNANQPQLPCSLIAPIMETLLSDPQRHSVIIVGNGEVFDLDDWTGDPRFDGWLLVRTGVNMLKKPTNRVSEIMSDQLDVDGDTLRDRFTRLVANREYRTKRASNNGNFRWQVDASGYPLIFVEPLAAYVHLFPVTKPQFEKFIASGRKREADDE